MHRVISEDSMRKYILFPVLRVRFGCGDGIGTIMTREATVTRF